jgi:predicted nucleotidyltransferase
MNEKELIEKNLILKVKTGSYLYGTNIPTSDEDYVGIFMPSEEYVFGLKKIEEIDLSVVKKDENNKNISDSIDCKYYEFRKFIKLAMECNPNILEILFTNNENITYINLYGHILLQNKKLFISKLVKQKFLGYAFSQKHKMQIKTDNYFDLQNALLILEKNNKDMLLIEFINYNKDYNHIFKSNYDKNHNTKFITVGDLNLQPSYTINKVISILNDRLSKVGNREELYTKYGYDVKFGMHLIRLMFEGIELLKTGNLIFPLKEKEYLKEIRKGNISVNEILKLSDILEKDIEKLSIETNLPSKPLYNEINQLCIDLMKKYFKEQNYI